jgi:hypothetical protein
MATIRRVGVYAKVSPQEQTCENQLLELRRYREARGWTATEYVDTGVSGAKDRRPALDQRTTAVRRLTSGRRRRLLAPGIVSAATSAISCCCSTNGRLDQRDHTCACRSRFRNS